MAISEAFSGTATIGTTEYDLPSNSTVKSAQTTDGIYQVFIDLTNMTANEQYIIRTYEKVISSGAQGLVDSVTMSGVQTEPIYVTPALLFLHGWTYTIQRVNTGGSSTDKSISWSIRQVA